MEEIKMLSVKIMQMAPIGGVPELTREEVAGALSSVSILSADLVRWKYAGDNQARARTYELIASVMDSAILDFYKPPVCPVCNGRGQAIINKVLHECEACEGSGKHYPRQSELAGRLGIRKADWQLPGRIYDSVMTVLMDAESEAIRALSKQLEKRN